MFNSYNNLFNIHPTVDELGKTAAIPTAPKVENVLNTKILKFLVKMLLHS